MSVMRIHKTRNYTVVSNVHLRDKRMSLKAKGLLTLMLSLPDDWDYSIAGLAAICKENKTAIQTTLKELEQFNYLKRTKERNQKGQFECIYEIFEVPQEDDNQSEQNSSPGSAEFCPPVPEKPEPENRDENPATENHSSYTYKQNTEDQVQKQNMEKKAVCLAVVAYLNEVTGASYRAESKKTQSLIEERLEEGYVLEDFLRVIDRKQREWTGTEFAQYLRPSTLFGDKFEGYLNAPEIPDKTVSKHPVSPSDMSDIVPGIF